MNIMTRDEAKEFLKKLIEDKRRWGKLSVVIDQAATVTLLEAVELVLGDDAPTVPKEEHTKVQRQLTAAKAREAKLKKQLDEQVGGSDS
jgi:hypothetical protein